MSPSPYPSPTRGEETYVLLDESSGYNSVSRQVAADFMLSSRTHPLTPSLKKRRGKSPSLSKSPPAADRVSSLISFTSGGTLKLV